MKGYSRILIICPLLIVFFLMGIAEKVLSADNLKFPLRKKYPHVKPIETAELSSIYNNTIIIDTRNKMEYEVIHMDGATNILVGRMTEGNLLTLRQKSGKKQLIFYCNGTTCAKSYKAADKAVNWGFKNVRVYDPGIFFWSKNRPQKAIFFGKRLTSQTVKKAFISKDKFNSVLIPPSEFIAKANSGKYTVIDGRDMEEVLEHPIKLPKIRIMHIDLMTGLLKKKSWIMPTSNLLVFDNVGKQVKWLQYYYERGGVTNYYFMKGGVRQWLADGYNKHGKK